MVHQGRRQRTDHQPLFTLNITVCHHPWKRREILNQRKIITGPLYHLKIQPTFLLQQRVSRLPVYKREER